MDGAEKNNSKGPYSRMEEAAPFFFAHFVPKSGTVVSERSRNARRKIVELPERSMYWAKIQSERC
jgi:hypothetical protein